MPGVAPGIEARSSPLYASVSVGSDSSARAKSCHADLIHFGCEQHPTAIAPIGWLRLADSCLHCGGRRRGARELPQDIVVAISWLAKNDFAGLRIQVHFGRRSELATPSA